MDVETRVTGGDLVLPGQGVTRADLLINQGRIIGHLRSADQVNARETISAEGMHIFPGVIDCHVHYGTGSPDTDYDTETASAAVGGVTTVITYFQNNRPYTEVLAQELEKGRERARVDFGIHLCLMKDEQLAEVARYEEEYGVSSFKFFMNFRGDEGRYFGVDPIDDGFLYDGFLSIAAVPGARAIVHAENIEIGWRFRKRLRDGGADGLAAWDASKPGFLEVEAVQRAAYLAKVARCPLYIAHVTAAETCALLEKFREQGSDLTAETCAHYLVLDTESKIGNPGKVNPPLRPPSDREGLWRALMNGTLDVVSTDHVPRKFATKKGNIWECSAGYPGTATLLPLMLDHGYHQRGMPLEQIASVLSTNPAKLFNLYPQKGSLGIGSDADITIVDLKRRKTVDAAKLRSFSDYSIYDGLELRGWPVATFVRGECVMKNGEVCGPSGHGRYVHRRLSRMF